ncbi:hypothetical protein ES705_32084 [subsurface metagenome]
MPIPKTREAKEAKIKAIGKIPRETSNTIPVNFSPNPDIVVIPTIIPAAAQATATVVAETPASVIASKNFFGVSLVFLLNILTIINTTMLNTTDFCGEYP